MKRRGQYGALRTPMQSFRTPVSPVIGPRTIAGSRPLSELLSDGVPSTVTMPTSPSMPQAAPAAPALGMGHVSGWEQLAKRWSGGPQQTPERMDIPHQLFEDIAEQAVFEMGFDYDMDALDPMDDYADEDEFGYVVPSSVVPEPQANVLERKLFDLKNELILSRHHPVQRRFLRREIRDIERELDDMAENDDIFGAEDALWARGMRGRVREQFGAEDALWARGMRGRVREQFGAEDALWARGMRGRVREQFGAEDALWARGMRGRVREQFGACYGAEDALYERVMTPAPARRNVYGSMQTMEHPKRYRTRPKIGRPGSHQGTALQSYGADRPPPRSEKEDSFVGSVKMGAGLGLGFLAVAGLFSLAAGAISGR